MNHLPKILLLAAGGLALGACWTEGDDRSAQEVDQAAEQRADQLDAAADNASGERAEQLEKTADVVRETGEAAAEAIDDNDLVLNRQ